MTPQRYRFHFDILTDGLVPQVPVLADTLKADTTDVVHGMVKHDMAEAIEHVVCGIGDIKEELREAFFTRDSGRTGALGGPAFKVFALMNCFDMVPGEVESGRAREGGRGNKRGWGGTGLG